MTPIYLAADFYKLSHREQYPEGTEFVYSTLTPRSNKYAPWSYEIVFFGLQYFIKEYLIERFNKEFFAQPKEVVLNTYKQFVGDCLGKVPDVEHLAKLHDLGYLPLEIKAFKEGSLVPIKCPVLTIENTHPDFFWLTNFIETILSTTIWQPITSATLAYQYRKVLDEYAIKTTGSTAGVEFQGHDFSMRGMSSEQSAMASGMGHLLSFTGTDTIPAIFGAHKYYNAPLNGSTGTSIPATEHSVMCSYGQVNEFDLFKHLITEVYPSGFFSVVSDTWDFWKVVTDYLPRLKSEILSRDGRVVIRPDSGNPVDIICGKLKDETSVKENKELSVTEIAEEKGLIEYLWDIFGGTITEQGYKVLNPHIGAIYGDSITLERAKEICKRLEAKGFASTNIVLGIGSFSYQYHTRDTFGFAVKATYAVVNGEERMLFKDPKTDDGTKRSQRGKVAVANSDLVDDVSKVIRNQTENKVFWIDGLTDEEQYKLEEEGFNLLETVFFNGDLKEITFEEIKKNLNE